MKRKILKKLGIKKTPWQTNLKDPNDLCIYNKKRKWVANLSDNKKQAILIAAAPDLLLSLIENERILGKWMSAAMIDHESCTQFKVDIRAWFATFNAINLATGKSRKEVFEIYEKNRD